MKLGRALLEATVCVVGATLLAAVTVFAFGMAAGIILGVVDV